MLFRKKLLTMMVIQRFRSVLNRSPLLMLTNRTSVTARNPVMEFSGICVNSKMDQVESMNVGDEITVNEFSVDDVIDVTGTSIGKGFQGVIKRWNFKGGRASHGSRFHRAPGSIGASATPSHVFKNKKMPGQMGNAKVTVQRLKIVRVDASDNLILIKGAVPGHKNSIVTIKKSVKA